MAASSMMRAMPAAAIGVSLGATRVIAGTINPIPPSPSQRPMKMKSHWGTAENHATWWSIRFHTAGSYARTLPKPVKQKKTPSRICVVHSMTFNDFIAGDWRLIMGFNLLAALRRSALWFWRCPLPRFYSELLRVLGVQALPLKFHRVVANDASYWIACEQPVKHIEADVPARGAPGDVAAVDVVPEGEAGATA